MKKMMILAGLAALFASSSVLAAGEEVIAQKAGCLACHTKDKKLVGPAYKDVAAKYKGQDVLAKLTDKVRKGGSGVWGSVPMPAHTPQKINDADLKAVVGWILKG